MKVYMLFAFCLATQSAFAASNNNGTDILIRTLDNIKKESDYKLHKTFEHAIAYLENKQPGDESYKTAHELIHSMDKTLNIQEPNCTKLMHILTRLKNIEQKENGILKRETAIKKRNSAAQQLKKLHSFGTLRNLNQQN